MQLQPHYLRTSARVDVKAVQEDQDVSVHPTVGRTGIGRPTQETNAKTTTFGTEYKTRPTAVE